MAEKVIETIKDAIYARGVSLKWLAEQSNIPQSRMIDFTVKLSKTYEFEGARISEIDLSGLENLTAEDVIKAQQSLTIQQYVTAQPETDPKYCLLMAAYATQLPSEFFYKLSAKDTSKLKLRVSSYFFDSETED